MSIAASNSLWKIEDDLLALMESVESCPEDLQAELQDQIALYLNASVEKVDAIAHVLAGLEFAQKCAGDEIARLQERKKAAAKAQDRLEAYVCRVIQAAGGKKLAGKTNTLSVRPSDAVVITDEVDVPDAYKTAIVKFPMWVWTAAYDLLKSTASVDLICTVNSIDIDESIDKAAIKKALKAGEEIPGADLEFRANLQRR